MRGMFWKSLGLLGCTGLLVGCGENNSTVSPDATADLKNQVAQLQGENTRLAKEASQAKQDAELARVDAEAAQKKADKFREIQPGAGVSPEAMTQFVSLGSGKHWKYEGGALRAQSDVFFDPGKADLKPQAKAAITDVAPKLKSLLADKSVVLGVYGYTDSDPLVRTKGIWKDNRHLSMMRAYAVVEALKEAGVPPESMYAAGWGEYHPISGAAKDKNRRVELVLTTSTQ